MFNWKKKPMQSIADKSMIEMNTQYQLDKKEIQSLRDQNAHLNKYLKELVKENEGL